MYSCQNHTIETNWCSCNAVNVWLVLS